MIIRFPWLLQHNPKIDWKDHKVVMSHCPPECQIKTHIHKVEYNEDIKPDDKIFCIPSKTLGEDSEILTTDPSPQTSLEERTFEDMVPKLYQDFCDVFSKEEFNTLPPHKPWDHAIKLTSRADIPHLHAFTLSPAEQKELDQFLHKNLANGQI